MSNKSDASKWFHRCRLAWLERQIQLKGSLNRSDLVKQFGISPAVASADFTAYEKMNPGALIYDIRRKTYRWKSGKYAIQPAPWADFPNG